METVAGNTYKYSICVKTSVPKSSIETPSKLCQLQKMTDIPQMLSSITPHFFKVVNEDTLREKKICIPKKFSRKHGGTLKSPITLQIPNGEEWKIELEKSGGKVWLKKGWLEFAKHHSVEQGHFLVFRYEGNSHFHVIIFDKSAMEIEYPINPTQFNVSEIDKDKLLEPKKERVEHDDSIEFGDNNSLFPKTGDESLFQHYSRPQKRMRTADKMSTHSSKPKSNVIRKKHRLSYRESNKANERALSGFKSENPFFSLVMQPSYVFTGSNNLPIAKKFAERYMNRKEGELTLGISDGRCWPIQYKTKVRSNSGSETTEIINRGWKAFAGDNHLEVGDVCIFEQIASGNNKIAHFQVSIVRYADHITPGRFEEKSSGGSGIGKGKSLGGSASKYPSFQMVLPLYSLTSRLCIPRSFGRSEFEKKKRQDVELKVGEKRWDVKLINNGDRYYLTEGWIGFAKENRLLVGDVCSFQMIQNKPIVLQICIARTN